jgi:adenosylcobyric acid synthase
LTANRGTELVGLCGGFQMLGADIADPHGLESDRKTIPGLGLLNISTILALEKTLTRVTATHLESGFKVQGYEIHHGQSRSSNAEPLLKQPDGTVDGARSPDGRLWGTYLHGIFDSDEFRRWFIDRLRIRHGLSAKGQVYSRYDIEPALDRLAETVRRSVQMDHIYRLMGLT